MRRKEVGRGANPGLSACTSSTTCWPSTSRQVKTAPPPMAPSWRRAVVVATAASWAWSAGSSATERAASNATEVSTDVAYSRMRNSTATMSSPRKMATPKRVPTIPVPASSPAPPADRSAVGVGLANAGVDLPVNRPGGVLEGGVEGDPHAHSDEGHDQDGYGGRDHALTPFVAAAGVACTAGCHGAS